MKLFEWWKGKHLSRVFYKETKTLDIRHNDNYIEGIKVLVNPLHHDTYRLLRKFKTPQYEIFFALKNKKGFNTLGFNINYDIIVTDRSGTVIDVLIDYGVDKVSKHYENGYAIYFMAVGTINNQEINKNDILKLSSMRKWIEL